MKFIINGKLRGFNSGGALIAATLIHLDWAKLAATPSLGIRFLSLQVVLISKDCVTLKSRSLDNTCKLISTFLPPISMLTLLSTTRNTAGLFNVDEDGGVYCIVTLYSLLTGDWGGGGIEPLTPTTAPWPWT